MRWIIITSLPVLLGGSGILVENPELRPLSKKLAIFLITISLVLALLFSIIYSSVTFLVIAIMGNILAWYYSAPPFKLSYRGLGEISTALTGLILPAFGYVALTGNFDLNILIFSISFVIYMIFFILSVEIPDLEGDKKGGKNTFIVKNGRKTGFALISLAGISGTLFLLIIYITGIYSTINFLVLVITSLIPAIVGLYVLIRRTSEIDASKKLVNLTVPSLVIFITILDLYFLSLIIT